MPIRSSHGYHYVFVVCTVIKAIENRLGLGNA